MSTEMTSSKFLSSKEISGLLSDLKNCSLRDRLVVSLLLNLGMRGAELLEISREDIDFSSNSIQVPGKKGSRPRNFPIPEFIRGDLKEYVAAACLSGDQKLFDLTSSGLKFIWYRLRPCKKGVHSLRHTFAIELFKKTRDVKLVQVCLGHKSILSTMVYADYVYSTEEMQSALGLGVFNV